MRYRWRWEGKIVGGNIEILMVVGGQNSGRE